MLKLRRGVVVGEEPLTVEVDGERAARLGRRAAGRRGARGRRGRRQHRGARPRARLGRLRRRARQPDPGPRGRRRRRRPRDEAELHLAPAPGRAGRARATRRSSRSADAGIPVLVIPLHGHLAPAAWAAAQAAPGLRVGYVQTAGGALPGRSRATSRELRERGLLCGHVTAGAGLRRRAGGDQRRRRARRGRAPARLGRGDRRARAPGSSARTPATATAGWRRSTPPTRRSRSGCRRCSRRGSPAADPRARHRGVSHHTADGAGAAARRGRGAGARGRGGRSAPALEPLLGAGTDCATEPVDLDGYAASGLPTRMMGRDLDEDRAVLRRGAGLGPALGEPPGPGYGGGLMERVDSQASSTRARWSTVRIDSFRDEDGATASARSSPTPGRSRSSPTTTSASSWSASRARRSARTRCSSCRPESSTSRGRRRCECAQRELEEEVGLEAAEWRELKRLYTSPGFADEEVHVFVATGLDAGRARARRGRARSRSSRCPLAELDARDRRAAPTPSR